jgi:hypothetical protein
MNANQALFLLIVLLAKPLCAAQSDFPRWPAEIKAAVIAGCREAILSRAEQDFLKRHKLTELPPNFRERIAPASEPFLAVCNCSVDRLEMEMIVGHVDSHRSEFLARFQELVMGECAPAIAKPPPPSSNEQSSQGVVK